MFEIVFLIILSLYFAITFYIITGIKKKFPKIKEAQLPYASVIVAARNEENNILLCLQSLDGLVYPDNKIEIIIVDDDSTDSTGDIIDEFIKGKKNFAKIRIGEPSGKLKGKVNALAEGIKTAKGEIILLTDADCRVPRQWATAMVSHYNDNTGVVNGFTALNAGNAFSGMQSIDVIYLISVASGMTNNGKPVSCIGNNMSFRKQAYEDAGGYENIPFSVTEDFALLSAIKKLKKYKIIHPMSIDTLILSEGCGTIQELTRQKKRWAVGGTRASLTGAVVMTTAFLTNLFLLLTPLFFSTVSLYLAVFKIAVDLFFLIPVHNELGLKKNLKYFFQFELYFILYVVSLPLILIFSRKVKWKGRVY